MKAKSKRIQKLITVSPQLYHLANLQAMRLGLSFPEYVRHLLANAVERKEEYIPMVDEETEKRIGESLKDIEKGNYIVVEPGDKKALEKALGL